MGTKKKVLIVVLALDAEPWRSIEERGQRMTWAVDGSAVPVLWLHGISGGLVRGLIRIVGKGLELCRAHKLVKAYRHAMGRWAAGRGAAIEGRELRTRVPETYLATNAKTVAAFRYLLLTQDFDYILRTNSSTYVNVPMLMEFVQTLPSEGYYGGTLWRAHGVEYATGTSILLSRDLVEHAARDPLWDFDLVDDLALGKSMIRVGVKADPFTRVDVYTEDDLKSLRPEDVASAFIVRCKGLEGRRHDIAAMHRVHQLYREAGLATS